MIFRALAVLFLLVPISVSASDFSGVFFGEGDAEIRRGTGFHNTYACEDVVLAIVQTEFFMEIETCRFDSCMSPDGQSGSFNCGSIGVSIEGNNIFYDGRQVGNIRGDQLIMNLRIDDWLYTYDVELTTDGLRFHRNSIMSGTVNYMRLNAQLRR